MQEINVSETVKAAKKFHDEIYNSVAALTSQKANINAKIKVLAERNQVLWRMPLARSDAKAVVLQAVDRIGNSFIEAASWRDSFRAFAFPEGLRPRTGGDVSFDPSLFVASNEPINLQDVEVLSDPRCPVTRIFGGEFAKNLFTGAGSMGPLDSRMMYFFFGDLIKAKVEKHFDSMFPDLSRLSCQTEKAEALSIEDRRAEISQNDAKIAELNVGLRYIEGQLKELSELGTSMRELHAPRGTGALGAVS